jgi:hypothetical protein
MKSDKLMFKGVGNANIGVNVWILANLGLGFLVTIIVPKLAIERLGFASYGIYALIIGLSAVMAFADLGVIPGLTKALGHTVASRDYALVTRVLNRVNRIAMLMAVILGCICYIVIHASLVQLSPPILFATTLFILTAYLTVKAEVRLTILRISGDVACTYHFRICYLLLYLIIIGTIYIVVKDWTHVWVIFFAQLGALLPVYLWLGRYFREHISPDDGKVTQEGEARYLAAWREIRITSSAERLNRVVQFTVGLIERPLLLATSGLAFVGSYDLVMRLMLIASAVPGALNQPLLSMLVHDKVRSGEQRKFTGTLRNTKLVTFASASIGSGIAIGAFLLFHQTIFGVVSLVPPGLGVFIAVTSGVNVLTASSTALLISNGIVWPCNVKGVGELVSVIGGAIAAWRWQAPEVFIYVRYLFVLIGALFLLIMEQTIRMKRDV